MIKWIKRLFSKDIGRRDEVFKVLHRRLYLNVCHRIGCDLDWRLMRRLSFKGLNLMHWKLRSSMDGILCRRVDKRLEERVEYILDRRLEGDGE